MSAEQARKMFYSPAHRFSTTEDRALVREELIYNVTEDLLVFMERKNVSRKELARMLGKSRSYVTQLLSGSRNMTLGTFSDICFALGIRPTVHLEVPGDIRVHGGGNHVAVQEVQVPDRPWRLEGKVSRNKTPSLAWENVDFPEVA